MLIDDVTIKAKAGNGGRGAVAFNTDLGAIGPNGGNGGKGGSIYFVGVNNLNALEQFRYQKDAVAQNGGVGHGSFVDGKDGEDLILKVPIGTVIKNLQTGTTEEILTIDQKVLAVKGGKGGKGNFKFRSSTNTSPKEFQPGLPGEEFDLHLELKLIADIGFVGLPNVGKSSLLNLLTNAKSKVADYHFTTLEPNLGSYYGLILADIPGLIEGASEGKGLGIKFLQHVERTKILFHFVSADSENIEDDYKKIRKELEIYNPELITKKEYLIITKTDNVDAKQLAKVMKQAKKINKDPIAISIYDDASLEPIKKILNEIKDPKVN